MLHTDELLSTMYMVKNTDMKKKKWIDVLVLGLLLIVSAVIRVIYVNMFMGEITVADSLAQQTFDVTGSLLQQWDGTLEGTYSLCLSYAMLFFGNKAIVGVGVNICLQLLSILFIYLCIRTVSDTTAAVIPSIIIAALPMYVTMVAHISSFSLLIVCTSVVIFVVLLILKGIVCGIMKILHHDTMPEDDTVIDESDDGIEYLAGEEKSEEDEYYEEEELVEEEDNEEPIEYLEDIGSSFEDSQDMNTLSESELGALLDAKEGTLSKLDYLEEQYVQQEEAAKDTAEELVAKEPYAEENSEEEFNIEEGFEEENQVLSVSELIAKEQDNQEAGEEQEIQEEQETQEAGEEQEIQKEQETQENGEEQEQPEDKSEDKEPVKNAAKHKRAEKSVHKKKVNYSFEPKIDFMHYDIEDMTGMDFYDLE